MIQAQAASFEMLNRHQAVQTYFALRQTNRAARAAKRGTRLDAESLAKIARQARPAPLPSDALDHRTGQVSWPKLLGSHVFEPCRRQLEDLLATRAATGRLDHDGRVELSQLTQTMLARGWRLEAALRAYESGRQVRARQETHFIEREIE